MNCKAIYLIGFSLCLNAQNASALTLCGKLAQGELISGHAANAQSVKLGNKEYQVTPNGNFILAFGRDEKTAQKLTITYKDGTKKSWDIKIAPTKWDIQNIKGVPPKKVNPPASSQKAIQKERTDLSKALSTQSNTPLWKDGFIRPLEGGRISGAFGGQRIMNGQKMNSHQGLDIATPMKTPIKASADGIVTLNKGPYFYSGTMVVLDHGQNLSTIYAHLDSVAVKQGQRVHKGDIIAYSGKSGRATGPHLHWGASLNGIRFNPQSLLRFAINKNCTNL